MIINVSSKLSFGVDIKAQKLFVDTPEISVLDPKIVVLPVLQQPGIPLKPVVTKGKTVSEGEVVASSEDPRSVPLHSSISGKVREVADFFHPLTGQTVPSIVIENDGKNNKCGSERDYCDYFRHDARQLLGAIRDCGIVGLEGDAFPVHVKLDRGRRDIDTLIVNAVECDAFISCDSALIKEESRAIIEGIRIVMHILDASKAIIALRNDNVKALETFSVLTYNKPNIFLAKVPAKYPQGDERVLIRGVLGRTVSFNENMMDAFCVAENVATIYAISRAIKTSENLSSRVVTVFDSEKKVARNLRVKNGTLLRDIAAFCKIEPSRANDVVMGSLMKGRRHDSLDVPLIKAIRGVFFLGAKEKLNYREADCVFCGKCARVCPANLLPNKVSELFRKRDFKRLMSYYPQACLECASCSFICPSYRNIFSDVSSAKREYLSNAVASRQGFSF